MALVDLPLIDLKLRGFMNVDRIKNKTASTTEYFMYAINYLMSYERSVIYFLSWYVMPELKNRVNAREGAWIDGFYKTYVWDGNNETIEPVSAILLLEVLETLLMHKYIQLDAGKYDYEIPVLPANLTLKPNNFYLKNFDARVEAYVESYYRHETIRRGYTPYIFMVSCNWNGEYPTVLTAEILKYIRGNMEGKERINESSSRDSSVIHLEL